MKRERHLYRYYADGFWIIQMGAIGGSFGYYWFGWIGGLVGCLGMTLSAVGITLAYHMQRNRNLKAWIEIRDILKEEWPEIKEQCS